jgi:hypothetical protein
MVKGGSNTMGRRNIGYVYTIIEELQQQREEVAILSEKNKQLAKQLVRFVFEIGITESQMRKNMMRI